MRDNHRIRTSQTVQQWAKDQRKGMTPSEKILWDRLRNRQLGGYKFRRQHPLGPFVADFCCPECRLVVEIDGEVHDLETESDNRRTEQLEEYGYQVIRFKNDDVKIHIDHVLRTILSACEQRLTAPLLSSGEG